MKMNVDILLRRRGRGTKLSNVTAPVTQFQRSCCPVSVRFATHGLPYASNTHDNERWWECVASDSHELADQQDYPSEPLHCTERLQLHAGDAGGLHVICSQSPLGQKMLRGPRFFTAPLWQRVRLRSPLLRPIQICLLTSTTCRCLPFRASQHIAVAAVFRVGKVHIWPAALSRSTFLIRQTTIVFQRACCFALCPFRCQISRFPSLSFTTFTPTDDLVSCITLAHLHTQRCYSPYCPLAGPH